MEDKNTVKYWDDVEAEKIAAKEKILAEIEALNSQRPAILVRAGEDDPSARTDLEKLNASIAKFKLDAEVLEAVLNTIPEKKARARSAEICAVIPSIEKIKDGIQPLVDDVNAKEKKLIAAVRKLHDHLCELDQIDGAQKLALASDFTSCGVGGLKSYGFLGTPGMSTSVDIEIVFLQMVYDPERLEQWVSEARNKVEKHIEKMKQRVEWLADPNRPDMDYSYCPRCYGTNTHPGYGKYFCSSCGEQFDPKTVL
jgi:hypothetical protein